MTLNLESFRDPVVIEIIEQRQMEVIWQVAPPPHTRDDDGRGVSLDMNVGLTGPAKVAPKQILIESERGIFMARQLGRDMAEMIGFCRSELTVIATVISELSRNIVQYAGSGKMSVHLIGLDQPSGIGISIIAQDKGPGIPNVALALQAGYSTSGGLGLGLSGVKRVMDEMEITSEMGRGTSVVVKKWKGVRTPLVKMIC